MRSATHSWFGAVSSIRLREIEKDFKRVPRISRRDELPSSNRQQIVFLHHAQNTLAIDNHARDAEALP